jgi:hypothetical protein
MFLVTCSPSCTTKRVAKIGDAGTLTLCPVSAARPEVCPAIPSLRGYNDPPRHLSRSTIVADYD